VCVMSAHALTMTLGTEWDELQLPYTDPRNGETAMNNAADRYRYVLERPIIDLPVRRWNYNGGATALLGRLIEKGTERQLHDFARDALFNPLGIGRTEWRRGADGEPIAASGLRLTPAAMKVRTTNRKGRHLSTVRILQLLVEHGVGITKTAAGSKNPRISAGSVRVPASPLRDAKEINWLPW
jgi:CubicO group peptidase (beta-lactamase class C family)